MNKTIVLPSARAIRHQQLQIEESSIFLPNYITINELISKLCIIKEYKIIDDDSRVLLLLEASNFKQFSKLQIERNFFTFTKNSSYIFKFFEELSAEKFSIDELNLSDIYGEYEEHIIILKELYNRYEELCKERKLLDRIFIPKLYTFNHAYAKSHDIIELYVDGHLTNFELELLIKATQYSEIKLFFKTSRFNKKMQNKLQEITSIEFESGYNYELSLNLKSVLEKKKIVQNYNISCESLSESLLQIAFIKQKVYEYVDKGYDPQKIAVVLPDESIAALLKSFDDKSNFNFAMGESFTTTKIYKKLRATLDYINQTSKENQARLNRVGDEIYKPLLEIYYKSLEQIDIVTFLKEYQKLFTNKREVKIYEEELYSFKNIINSMLDMSIKSILSLFLQRLASRSIDDVRGGKITVMGVLETRSVAFDGVIIVDFSDSNVPKKSDKDMFLNSAIREMANLPTMSDRENLQKHYYEALINNSKEVAISFVSSTQSSASRFLKQLNIKEEHKYSELDYASILFNRRDSKILKEEEIIEEYSFKNVNLSSTRLKIYLTCKRKYYMRYVKHLKSHEIPKDMPKEWEIGIDIHSALKELYSKKSSYSSVDELQRDLEKELDNAVGKSELDKYLMSMQKKRMKHFCENEVKRFSQGWSVFRIEESLNVSYKGMNLVGQIDRVDKRTNEIEVIDYKTGSYPLYTQKNFTQATDFQLEFYHLLASGYGNVVGAAYYDLTTSKIVPEVLFKEKMAILESHIADLQLVEELNFMKCEDIKECLFCEFKILCGRE